MIKLPPVSPLDFFAHLKWIDGRPLLDTIEPYRRELFSKALYTFQPDGTRTYNLVLAGRGKKNWKTADLVLAGMYCLLIPESPHGNAGAILASDEGQAGDDLKLAKLLVRANPDLGAEVECLSKEIRRLDDRGSLVVLPARDVAGAHGKTFGFLGFDEIHSYRNWDLLEALQPDPTRTDVLTWVTSYDTLYPVPGVPLYDLKQAGMGGDDPRMLFSWYSADLCTDPVFANLPPEQRANPSMGSWPDGPGYLEQQGRRLPSNKFRRLHLNLPGAPSGAFFDSAMVMRAIVPGLRVLQPDPRWTPVAFVDMSGGSHDDAVLALAHMEGQKRVLDLVVAQNGGVPFDPRAAVRKFSNKLRDYGVERVIGDAYAGQTFRADFDSAGISYRVSDQTKSEIYESFETLLNAGEVELLDQPKLQEQLFTLVVRGARIDHLPGDYDDWANAACGALVYADRARARNREYREVQVEGAGGFDPLQGIYIG